MSIMVRVDRFLRTTRMSPTRFGRLALNDPRLVTDLRQGRELRAVTRARVLAYIDRAERGAC